MSYLDLPPEERPGLPTRERIEGAIEVQCPACQQWRRGFLLEPLSVEDAAARGADWACDGDRARWAREAIEAAGPTLEQMKETAMQAVESARNATMNGGCPCTVGVIDSDETSRLFVSGAVNMAQIAKATPEPFTIRWRLQDNSYADLDADGMIAMGVELGQFVNSCCQTAFDLKDEIDAATDAEAVAAVDIAAAFAALLAGQPARVGTNLTPLQDAP